MLWAPGTPLVRARKDEQADALHEISLPVTSGIVMTILPTWPVGLHVRPRRPQLGEREQPGRSAA